MKKFLPLLILLFGTLAWGQASRLDGQVTGPTGAPVHFPTIRVCTASATSGTVGTTNFCGTLATLYADHLATACSGSCNPLTGDYSGNYHFYAAAGRIIVDIISNGVLQSETVDQIVPCEQGVTCGGSATLSGGTNTALTIWTGPNTVGASNLFESAGTFSTTDTVDLHSAAALRIPVVNTVNPTTSGQLVMDTANSRMKYGDGANTFTLVTTTDLSASYVQTTVGATFGNFIYDFSGVSEFRPMSGLTANKPATCSANPMDVYLARDATAGQNWYFCTATNTWTQQLNSGGAGGASTNLSNLNAVAFNVALTPNSGNAGTSAADLGSGSAPIDALWLGGASTNNTKITSLATAARTVAFPDASGTVALLSVANVFTANQTVLGLISSSSNPSTTGFLRLANSDAIKFRNAANNADINGLTFDSNNFAVIGGSAGAKVAGLLTGQTAGAAFTLQPLANTGNGAGGDLTLQGGSAAGTGNNSWVHILPGTGGTGTPGFLDFGTSGITFLYSNDNANPTTQYLLTSLTSTNTVTETGTNAVTGIIGICVSANCATPGATVSVAPVGEIPCVFDNTPNPGDVVTPSQSAAGECHSAGTTVPASTAVVGSAGGIFSTGIYYVTLALGGGGSATLPATVVVTNPATTAADTIQATSSTATSLTAKCPTGALSGQVCFQVLSSSGSNLFSLTQGGTITLGGGSGGTLTIGTITASHFNSATGTTGTSALMNLANADGISWENNAGNASATLISKNTSDNLVIGGFNPGTSISLVLGTTNNFTLTASNPAAPRTVTFGDPGGADNVAYLNAAQTFQSKTFNDQVTINGVASLAGNPSGTACSIWYNSGTGKLAATNNAGADCTWSSGGGSGALSGLTNAVAANTLTNGDNAQLWKWTLSTAGKIAMRFSENAAATNGVGAQYITEMDTLASSTASPLGAFARGQSNGFQVDATTGNIKLLGSAGIDLNSSALYKEFANEGVTGTTQYLLAKLNGTNNNVIKATTADIGNLEGICVNGCGTTGNAQIAVQGFVTATFDGATTQNDCVVASTTVAGNVHDVACSALNGEQLLGRVLSTNGAGGNYVMDLYGVALPGIAVGATNGLTISTATNGSYTLDLPQNLKTSNKPQFAGIALTAGITGAGNSQSFTIQCGQDSSSTGGCTLTLAGANETGTGSSNAGSITIKAGNSASTGTGNAGSVTIQPGQATAAANKNGSVQVAYAYIKGATVTANNVQCFSADNTVSDCATSSKNFVGVNVSTNGNAALVISEGSQVTVNYDATVSPSAGWFACMSATVAGKVTAQSAACGAGLTVGIIEAGGTNVTSGNITLKHF